MSSSSVSYEVEDESSSVVGGKEKEAEATYVASKSFFFQNGKCMETS